MLLTAAFSPRDLRTSMLTYILHLAFTRANERPGLILLDILWKLVWLFFSIGAVILVAVWFGSNLQNLAWDDTGRHAVNALIAATAAREFWQALKGEIVGAIVLVALFSTGAWFLLEAGARMRFVTERASFRILLLSNLLRSTVLTVTAIILLPVILKGAPVLAVLIFFGFAFSLALLETLIRADAIELLGTDLIRVTALIGILMSVELMIAASFVAVLAAGFLNVARLSEALAMLGATAVCAVLLTVLHSYLLLVRFCAVGIMRQNVVAV